MPASHPEASANERESDATFSRPRQHGGTPRSGEGWLDLSASLNPYAPSERMERAVREADFRSYPDSDARPLKSALARQLGVGSDQLAIGNGSADLLWALARLLVLPMVRVGIVEPTFGEFRAACEVQGARVTSFVCDRARGFAIDLGLAGAQFASDGVTVAYLCSPNTPTGVRVPPSAIQAFADAHPQMCVILDQAFVSLSDHPEDREYVFSPNVFCVRSLTKDYAIAGLRLGYVLAPPHVIRWIESQRPSWSINTLAQAAGIALLEDGEMLVESRRKLLNDRTFVAQELTGRGYSVVPSAAPFVLFGGLERSSFDLAERLLQRKVVIRDCRSFGLPGMYRVAARPREETLRFFRELDAVCGR